MIYLGDCVEVLSTLSPEFVDTCITSPPYNAGMEYEKTRSSEEQFWEFTEQWVSAVYRAIKPNGKCFINTGWFGGSRKERFFLPSKYIEICQKTGFRFQSWINWCKGSLEAPQTAGAGWGDVYTTSPSFLNGDEPILYFVKPGKPKRRPNKHDNWIKFVRTPWVMPCAKKSEHPAAFPLELPERCLLMTTLEGDTVLDPFGGSGTTGLACKKHNREYVLIEKHEPYYNMIKEKLDA